MMRTFASLRCAISQTVTGLVTMATMLKFIRLVLLCLMAGSAFAQSLSPPCQGYMLRWTNCFGTETLPNGDNYVGEFKDGKRNGQGTLTYANGGKFAGEWLDGLRHGLGMEYRADESIVSSGRWERGIIVTEQVTEDRTEIERKAELRQKNLARMQGLAGFQRSPSELSPPASITSKKLSSSYPSLLIAKIKPNLTFSGEVIGNPRTEIEVDIDPNGNILKRRIVQSSGLKAWDDAVLRAIDRTAVLPKDIDGRVPPKIIFAFRPYD
jgi:TonB family protein